MRLIDIATLINVFIGIFQIIMAMWQMLNNNIGGMIFNMLLAICGYLMAILTAIISNRKY
ncbi:MAG: hypothetical protein ACRDB9_10245 [Cetobacterium sp.]